MPLAFTQEDFLVLFKFFFCLELLPPASERWQKVMFSQVCICLLFGGERGYPHPANGGRGGTPIQPIGGGYPHPFQWGTGLDWSTPCWGYPPIQTWEGGTPHPDMGRGYPLCPDMGREYPLSRSGLRMGGTPYWNIACTGYEAVGILIAFTQGDFLV